ncbi:kappaPI-actitoxin-Avd3c-like [Drosophila busckii]|uniref:kappaPI-actitoxin-Avd3c-like n=1 Tax=Drosophila busckii TaxID=30019 RepID=UPI00083EBBA8|nr:kappaPI-actitoxin-Avd3c-like [Drosophila busckii]
MKFVVVLICLALFVVYAEAQNCRGKLAPRQQNCLASRDEGRRRARSCRRSPNKNMWYYNASSRTCMRMNYRGCGGNGNRYCTKAECEQKCVRRSS